MIVVITDIECFQKGLLCWRAQTRKGCYMYFKIEQSKIMNLNKLSSFDLSKIQLGVPVAGDEASRVGLSQPGEAVLPSASFGCVSRRNAFGRISADKNKPKEPRYITTVMVYPYGNTNASPVTVDIVRSCYPQTFTPPSEIEFVLYQDVKGERFVIANLTPSIRKNNMLDAVNLLLEIYGCCYVFKDEIVVDKNIIKHRCNWEILPPGKRPSVHFAGYAEQYHKRPFLFDVKRLEIIEEFTGLEEIVAGLHGFQGYYAFVFSNFCVLESAGYGKATYIIPKDNWKTLSKKTKKELLDEDRVIEKIIHSANWERAIVKLLNKLSNR